MIIIVSVAVIAAAFLVAVFYAVPVLIQVRRTAREVEKLAEVLQTQITPLGKDLAIISHEMRIILESFHHQAYKVEEGIAAGREIVVSLRDFEKEIRERIEKPLLQLSALIRAVNVGVATLIGLFRR